MVVVAAAGVAVEGEAVLALLLNKDPEGAVNGCAVLVLVVVDGTDSDFGLKNEVDVAAGAAGLNENVDVDADADVDADVGVDDGTVDVVAVIGVVVADVLNENSDGFVDGVAGVVGEIAALKNGAVGDLGIDAVVNNGDGDGNGDGNDASLFDSPQFDIVITFCGFPDFSPCCSILPTSSMFSSTFPKTTCFPSK